MKKYFGIILSIWIHPSFLAKDLTRATQTKNEQLINNIIDGFSDLENAIIKKFLKMKTQVK